MTPLPVSHYTALQGGRVTQRLLLEPCFLLPCPPSSLFHKLRLAQKVLDVSFGEAVVPGPQFGKPVRMAIGPALPVCGAPLFHVGRSSVSKGFLS